MRYWVYQDARVQGPFSREDLASVQGLGPDSLVCKADSSSGAKEADWTALSEMPELAELYLAGAGVSLAPAYEGSAAFEQFRKESEDILDRVGYPDAWVSGVFEDPAMFDAHAGLGGLFGAELPADPDKGRTAELEGRLCQLQDQLEEYEKRTNEILDALGAKDKTIEELKHRLEEAAARPAPAAEGRAFSVPASDTPPPVAKSVPEPALEPSPEPVPEPAPEPEPEAKALPVEEPAFVIGEPDEASAPAIEEFAPPQDDAPPPLEVVEEGAPATEVLSGASAIPDAQDFVPPMPEEGAAEPPPLEAAPQAPGEAGAAEPSPLEAPASEAPAFEPPPLEPPPLEAPPAELGPLPSDVPGMEQPRTMVFGEPGTPVPDMGGSPPLTAPPSFLGAPGPLPTPGIMEPPLTAPPSGLAPGAMPGQMPTPMPIPLGGVPTPMPGEMTPMPGMGQPDIPQTVLAGMGVGATTTPIPGMLTPGGQSFEELMGKPATAMPELTPAGPIVAKTGIIRPPSPEETGDAQGASKLKKFGSKKFLIGLGAAGVVLAVLLVLFFQNPSQVQQMVDPAPEQSAAGDIDVEDPQNPFGTPPPDTAPEPASPFGQAPQDGAPPQTASPFGQPSQSASPFGQAPRQAAPEPSPAPAASSGGMDFIQDDQIQAMEFVKNYVLSGAKGTIDGWLNYSFPPPNMPQWSAGAVSKDVWLVEYLVFKGPKSKKPEITYSFEVNLKSQSLTAGNAKTRSLLAGSEGLNKSADFEPPSKRPQALPGDEDDPGSAGGGNGGFNNPGSGEY